MQCNLVPWKKNFLEAEAVTCYLNQYADNTDGIRGMLQYRCCCCFDSSQSAWSSTAAHTAGRRSCALSPNTAAFRSCCPASCNSRIFPSEQDRRRRRRRRWAAGEHIIIIIIISNSSFHNMHPSPYPVVEHGVLRHAVGSAELFQLASVVAVQHLLADPWAVSAGTPRMIFVTRHLLVLEEKLAVWMTGQAGCKLMELMHFDDFWWKWFDPSSTNRFISTFFSSFCLIFLCDFLWISRSDTTSTDRESFPEPSTYVKHK